MLPRETLKNFSHKIADGHSNIDAKINYGVLVRIDISIESTFSFPKVHFKKPDLVYVDEYLFLLEKADQPHHIFIPKYEIPRRVFGEQDPPNSFVLHSYFTT